MTRLSRDTWLSYAWLTQAGVQWAERDPIGVLAGASPTNGSPGLPLPLPYIYMEELFSILTTSTKRFLAFLQLTIHNNFFSQLTVNNSFFTTPAQPNRP
jgi:hypothetical protein